MLPDELCVVWPVRGGLAPEEAGGEEGDAGEGQTEAGHRASAAVQADVLDEERGNSQMPWFVQKLED